MRTDNPVRHFLFAFLIAVAIYAIAYSVIEHLRLRKGPWQVTYTTDSASQAPCLVINQTALGLTNVQILFPYETALATNVPVTYRYDQPREVPFAVPFGECIFMDTTFLPGTLTLQLLGHEIELLPRTMIIDHAERAWHSGQTIALDPTGKGSGGARP